MIDYLIRNGRVIDPLQGIDGVMDVAIKGNKFVNFDEGNAKASHVIDATDCIVTPGLIDFHTHLFCSGSGFGISPDMMVAQGTTSAVDAGTAGVANFDTFYKSDIIPSTVRIRSFLTPYSGGQLDPKLLEDFNPEFYNLDRLERLIDKYPEQIIGLKIRLSKGVVPDEKSADYLKAVIDLADSFENLRVCVHVTNSFTQTSKIATMLRKDDVFCHCFHGTGDTILDENGKVLQEVIEARNRGVIFDAANGKGNFSVKVAQQCINQGFLPDIISSDLTLDKFNMPPFAKNFPTVMSKYLSLGVSLYDVIRMSTMEPAKAMNLDGKIGTLRAGSYADLVILKQKEAKVLHRDSCGEEFLGDTLLIPQLTICDGKLQFCQTDFYI